MAKLGDIKKSGYNPFGMEDDAFIDIRDLAKNNREIVIEEVEHYTNRNGEDGVYIRFRCEIFDEDVFTATKAVNIVNTLKDENVLETLKTEPIECTVTTRPSKDDKSKTCYVLV